MKIAFIWQGFDGRYGMWRDGLYAAMKLLEEEHEVKYFDFPLKGLMDFNPDVVLYWEAPVTNKGQNAENWFSVCALPYKKALLFAGGPLKAMDVKDFDLVFVESQINEEDCEREGIPYKRAFGVNTQIMKPMNLEKKWDAMLQATSASWKRQWLMAEAFRDKSLLCGRFQETDSEPFNRSKKLGATVLLEQPAEEVAKLINESVCVCNTSEYWGGGQRASLESLACGVPVICMADSPKNREYIEESGAGVVCEPDANSIKEAFKLLTPEMGLKGIKYVQEKYTEKHYANSLLEGIQSII